MLVVMPTLSNGAPVAYYSTSAFAGNGSTLLAVATVGLASVSMPNLPYTTAQLIGTSGSTSVSPAVAGRIVSCSVKGQYTGTVLNASGLYYSLCTPDHENINGLSMSDFAETSIKAVKPGNFVEVVAAGQSDAEVSYSNNQSLSTLESELLCLYPFCNGNAFNTSDTDIGAPIMKIVINGVAGQTMFFEIVTHAEYVGYLTSGRITPSHTDSRGFEIVQQAAASIPMRKLGNPTAAVKDLMIAGIHDAARALAPAAGQLVRRGVRNVAMKIGGRIMSTTASAAGLGLLTL